MGGSTGQTKDSILLAMAQAERQGKRIFVKDLAVLANVRMSTISGHLRELHEKFGYVCEHKSLRGRWGLTDNGRSYAESLLPPSLEYGIGYWGFIAAGPAVPMVDSPLEQLPTMNLDPLTHFAMHVRGGSMVTYDILDGDLVVFRRVSSWTEVGEGKIVAACVPEGTGVNSDWLDALERNALADEDAHLPQLDHVTLKQFDARFRAYLHRGLPEQQANIQLRGSNGTLRPRAVAIAGVLVRKIRDYE